MVDRKDYVQGNKIGIDTVQELIKNNNTTGVITKIEDSKGDFGNYPKATVEVGGKEYTWNINQKSAKNLSDVYGYDDENWVGKKVWFTLCTGHNNKPMVEAKTVREEEHSENTSKQ